MMIWINGKIGLKGRAKKMSRVTQFIAYINERYEPEPKDKLILYTSLTLNKKIQKYRKERQRLKR